MQINDEKLNEVLDVLEGTLSCPQIYDVTSEFFERSCSHSDCRDCWEEYLKENPLN